MILIVVGCNGLDCFNSGKGVKKMRCFIFLVIVLFCTQANAYWQEEWVKQTRQVHVYPAPVWERCSHGALHQVQPAPHWEERTEWIRRLYWVPDVIIYDAPRVVSPTCIPWSTLPVYVW